MNDVKSFEASTTRFINLQQKMLIVAAKKTNKTERNTNSFSTVQLQKNGKKLL
jgi:hypothetical protein